MIYIEIRCFFILLNLVIKNVFCSFALILKANIKILFFNMKLKINTFKKALNNMRNKVVEVTKTHYTLENVNLIDKLFIKQRSSIIKRHFNGIECATKDYNNKVYNVWYVEFKTNISIILGIVGVILSIVSIFITLL